MAREKVTRPRNRSGNNWFTFRRMASNLIRVNDAGASKLRMPRYEAGSPRARRVKIEDVMVTYGWLRENGPGDALMVEIKKGLKAPDGQSRVD